MTTTRTIPAGTSTGTGRQAFEDFSLDVPDTGTGRTVGLIGVLAETVAVTAFTDGGAAVGTYQMQGSVPAGAVLLGSKVLVPAGFAGNVSATIIVGDGSDTDRYITGTPDVFTTAATGVQSGVPSGNKLITTANRPTLTVTTSSDFTAAVSNGSGIVTVVIYYLQTA